MAPTPPARPPRDRTLTWQPGASPTATQLGRLSLDLEDLPIPQKCDIQAYESIDYEPLRRHIDEMGSYHI